MKKTFTLLLTAFLLSFTLHAQIISTVAGGGVWTPDLGDGGAATGCELQTPIGVATDGAGNLYIADRDNNRIRKVSASGIVSTIAGTGTAGYSGDGGPATLAMLNTPYGVVTDNSGNIYITDAISTCLRKIDVSGIITTIAGAGLVGGYSGDNGPATNATMLGAGLPAIDGTGNIYIPEFGNNCIRKIDPSGIITTVAGNGIRGYSGDGGAATAAELNNPGGVATDGTGNIFITDYNNNRIRRVSVTGIITTVAGTGTAGHSGDNGPATAANIKLPLGITTDAAGNVYIGVNDYCVRKISTDGTITTMAGTGTNGSTGDGGSATDAKFQSIAGICINHAGNMFIADGGNSNVRKIDSKLSITDIDKTTEITTFPNPSKGNFTMKFSDNYYGDVDLVISNSIGTKMISMHENVASDIVSINTDLCSGIYLLTAITSKGILYKTINIIK